MKESTFLITGADGVEIFVYRWQTEATPIGVVQIAHGMAEHAARYARLAEKLNEDGYAVYASDLRGHGRTAKNPEDLGFFGVKNGWRLCAEDLWRVNRRIAEENPRLPIILLGHSMGALLARQLMRNHGQSFAAVVLSGSNGQPTPMALAGRAITRAEKLRLGARGKSKLIQSLTFDTFNKRFEPARTRFDWLSRDPAEVNKYVADPLCGFNPSVQLWIDMLDAWAAIAGDDRVSGAPRDLPIYVISGERDPVSAGTKMLTPMLEQYRKSGLTRVEHKFYPEARHELLNETNREEVTKELLEWMNRVIG
ncbi:MAG TPA: alpha/beta hydrolase [Candidatus Limnocylindrales bacterium]|nr:alpha/beta hydrolase [Candidatus Limnocylindrales bacterium]